SIIPKLYELIGLGEQKLGRMAEAQQTFRSGLERYQHNVELLVRLGLLLRESGDLAGAGDCFRRALAGPRSVALGGQDLSLRGYKTRHALAETLARQGRIVEARVEWMAVLAEQPGFAPARQALGLLGDAVDGSHARTIGGNATA